MRRGARGKFSCLACGGQGGVPREIPAYRRRPVRKPGRDIPAGGAKIFAECKNHLNEYALTIVHHLRSVCSKHNITIDKPAFFYRRAVTRRCE